MTTRTRVIAPLATFAVVAGIVAAASLLPRDGGGSRPPVLVLSGSAGAQSADASRSAGGGYRLTGPLPEGTPPDAAVWTLEGSDDLTALRKALGGEVTLMQKAWWYSGCATDQPLRPDSPVSSSGCGVATTVAPGSTPPSPKPALSKDAVRAKAKPVFDAVGLDVDEATVTTSEYGGSVALTPPAGALYASGYTTRVDVDASLKVLSASGFLSGPTAGDTYPLVTAREAFDQLPFLARGEACQVAPDGQGCVEPPAPEITGATVGLQLVTTAKGEQVLVPAWLFDLKGSDEPLAQIAIDPEFLGTAPEPTGEPGPKPSSGSGGGSEPVPPPADGGDDPAREAISFDQAFRGSTPASVVVQFGQSGSCPRTNVTHSVKESADAVYVVLEADRLPADQACTADYNPVKVTVKLQAALGDRKVFDASRNSEVRLS